ncbi:MAG: radical SAM family heme chaperone HemW [Clostridia bacterium]|nr:radical SAM family heme chaperone HemW [Clostridia bacterium]
MTDKPIGLYIHIPFCRSKCPYCDFYSMRIDEGLKQEYIEAVKREIQKSDCIFDTVYFGGGTPSQLKSQEIAEILSVVSHTDNCEITVECNPSDTGRENSIFDFDVLASAGVNRISMGLQSAVDGERKALGRLSGKEEVLNAINKCHKAGIDNISLDLMLGIPYQTIESLNESVSFCINSGVKHISAYLLKIEDNTYFGKNRDKLILPDEDTVSDMYLTVSETLRNNGFNHYEISNFSLPGYESKHNCKYWECKEYLGIGPSAHSFIDGKRLYYDNDINKFISEPELIYDDKGGSLEEYIMLGLRLSKGINFCDIKQKYSYNFNDGFIDYCRFLQDKNLLNLTENGFALTPEGFLLSNSVICELTDRL